MSDSTEEDRLFRELEEIHDAYRTDVKQFLGFLRERHLPLMESLKAFSAWLEEEHDGRRYRPATINRKIAAAKNRIRYAFKHSSSADNLSKKYRLEEVLKDVKMQPVHWTSAPAAKSLSIDEVKKFILSTKDSTIKLMVTFLVGTGVRVSEMLAVRLSDLRPVDTDPGFIEVRILGKGRKERRVHVKTGLIDRIRGYFQGADYLFEHHGRPFSRVSVTNRIKHEALKTIGREVSAHNLRHTWAMIQMRRGKDLGAIAVSLGYAEPGSRREASKTEVLDARESFLDMRENGGAE